MDRDAKNILMEHLNKHKESIEQSLKFFKNISKAENNQDFIKDLSQTKEDMSLYKETYQHLENALSSIKALEFDYTNRAKS